MNAQDERRMLVISYEYPPLGGGGAKVVDGIVSRLIDQGYKIDVVTMGFRGLPRHEERGALNIFRIPGIRRNQTMCHAYEMLPYIVIATFVAWKLARKNNYAINHTHFILPDSLISAFVKKMVGVPFVTTAHGSDVPDYNPNRFKFMHKMLGPIWRRLTLQIDCIISPSFFIEKLIRKLNSDARVRIIPNGIDLDKFSPAATKKKMVLCVTRMFERKGVQYLIEAFDKIGPADWKLCIVGDGPYLADVEAMAKDKDNIDVLGFLENDSADLRNLYEESAIFSLPSASENFPIVLLEAMTAGAAVITTKHTGCADVVGDTAELVTPRNTDELAAALRRLIDDPDYRKELASRGRKRVEDNFSWESVVDQHTQLYREIIKP